MTKIKYNNMERHQAASWNEFEDQAEVKQKRLDLVICSRGWSILSRFEFHTWSALRHPTDVNYNIDDIYIVV